MAKLWYLWLLFQIQSPVNAPTLSVSPRTRYKLIISTVAEVVHCS